MKTTTKVVAILGVAFALLALIVAPQLAAQKNFRLAWYDSRTGSIQHDKH